MLGEGLDMTQMTARTQLSSKTIETYRAHQTKARTHLARRAHALRRAMDDRAANSKLLTSLPTRESEPFKYRSGAFAAAPLLRAEVNEYAIDVHWSRHCVREGYKYNDKM